MLLHKVVRKYALKVMGYPLVNFAGIKVVSKKRSLNMFIVH